MFTWVELHRRARRHLQTKHPLGVVRHPRRVAVAPVGVDLVNVFQAPVGQHTPVRQGVDARFLLHLAGGCGGPRLGFKILGAGDGLPEPRRVGALDEQDLQCRGVDDDEDGLGDFVDAQSVQALYQFTTCSPWSIQSR